MEAHFEFLRFRFHFRALDTVRFPAGKSSNVIRGALGLILRDTASPSAYARLFEPGNHLGQAPSGLGDWPRPFVLRAEGLDGRTIPGGGRFSFDVHIFDLRPPVWAWFQEAFAQFGAAGIGPGRGRVALERTQQIDLQDRDSAGPITVALTPPSPPSRRIQVQFVTPTELKCGGEVAPRPEFPVLFARLRDRISTLRALYGPSPLDIDFAAWGRRAAAIGMTKCDVRWEKIERKSGRTGQVHPLGGFTGEAVYEGDLAEFIPWLRAARWVGVGRQTVWGKGDVRVGIVEPAL